MRIAPHAGGTGYPAFRDYPPRLPPPPPRISGTAMPHGVFLSTGANSTAGAPDLFITGFGIVFLGMLSLVPTYVITWTVNEQLPAGLNLSLVALLLGLGGPADPALWAVARIGLNVLTFFVFLGLLRLTPLAAHHAAEHMTVHAIEQYGVHAWEHAVEHMPRAHLRCGTNLLAGILPAMLVAIPLMHVSWVLGLPVVVLGWSVRFQVGYFIQRTFTTRPPSPRQLERGIAAGRKLLDQWLRDPTPRLSVARRMWRRGLPQMVAGVLCALWLIETLANNLHLWLDW